MLQILPYFFDNVKIPDLSEIKNIWVGLLQKYGQMTDKLKGNLVSNPNTMLPPSDPNQLMIESSHENRNWQNGFKSAQKLLKEAEHIENLEDSNF